MRPMGCMVRRKIADIIKQCFLTTQHTPASLEGEMQLYPLDIAFEVVYALNQSLIRMKSCIVFLYFSFFSSFIFLFMLSWCIFDEMGGKMAHQNSEIGALPLNQTTRCPRDSESQKFSADWEGSRRQALCWGCTPLVDKGAWRGVRHPHHLPLLSVTVA